MYYNHTTILVVVVVVVESITCIMAIDLVDMNTVVQ